MAPSLIIPFLLLLTLTLLQPPRSAAKLHKTAPTTTTYFEVTRPIPLPKTQPCSHSILHHQEFAYTYAKPPIIATYSPPPSKCQNFDKAVLEWTATCRGRQFDRIFGVWLGGVELLRSCTAEPTPSGIVWTVKKDVTRYRSLLLKEQNVSIYMGNIVDATYTGVYHVNLTFHFYPALGNHAAASPADFILPISRTPPFNGGAWFEIDNSTTTQGRELQIPNNAYRAVMEVYVSFHENDEFWYGNFPNEYISFNNLTDVAGNGPFREVVVRLDGVAVGAVWPFTVIYTGGVNPFFWRPISAIGSFDLPTYDIEITPFLGKLLDSKPHFFGFSVTNGLNVWYVDANLHLWVDSEWERTSGELLEHSASPLSSSTKSRVSASAGTFTAKFSRSMAARGRVESSHGVITTESRQVLRYSNEMELRKGGDFQVLNQLIKVRGNVAGRTAAAAVYSAGSRSKFGVRLYSNVGNESDYRGNVKLVLEEKWRERSELGSSFGRLKNLQSADGFMVVEGKSKSLRGLGRTQQDYRYYGNDSCYFRKLKSSNYTILHDKQTHTCKCVPRV
ncbi:peptide-N4-(N-acetyl-beta-glucosaminyl)asparagine amidase A-like [Salvia miltiorrhiza]|uniref:peptide-N4-(N-acetyl-beta- glucosaminyl)asparagine amidase A-like n=1 Tax=Salvia miltiorrhiza TaxID=226208 RepID=UPI0025AD8D05|nr:peptide-N4-(N-acetyl-beta-glucosaminyl)asparagine amidase A-like [Salvia miltiorrhiza]